MQEVERANSGIAGGHDDVTTGFGEDIRTARLPTDHPPPAREGE